MDDPDTGDPVTSCMDVYKAKNQYDGSIDKLKLRILIRRYLKNKEMIGDTWSPTSSTSTIKYFLADASKYKERVHPLDFIGEFLQANVKRRVFVKLDSRHGEYFLEYCNYFLSQYIETEEVNVWHD